MPPASAAGSRTVSLLKALAFLVTLTRTQVNRFFDRQAYDPAEIVDRFNRRTDEALEPDDLYRCYFELAEETVHPQHISIFVRDPKSGMLLCRAARGIDGFGPGYAVLAEEGEIRELARAEKSGLLARKARTAQLSGSHWIWGFAFFAPLISQGEVIGRVNLGPKRSDRPYSDQDQRLLAAMAHRLADKLRLAEMVQVAVAKARLDQELATARNIQAAMLPTELPVVRGIDVACASRPAHEFGGDYYDLALLAGGQLAVAIGDVAGKGVQAALVMAMTKAAFYTLIRQDPAIEPMMSGLNQMICDSIPDKTHRKTTFCYAIVDRDLSTVTYSCAGHPPPLVFRGNSRSCERLAAPGAFPLGASRRTRYDQQTVAVRPGDALVFFTDGITEARDPAGDAFYDYLPDASGAARECDELADVIARYGLQPARTLKEAILARLAAFTGTADQADDATIVVVKVV